MADEFQIGSGNWWDSNSSRNRFDSGASPPSSSALSSVGSFGWPTEIVDLKARSSMDSVSVSGSSMVFHDTQKMPGQDSGGGDSGSVLVDPSLQMMRLGLSAQAMDWNPTLLRGGGKADSFRPVLQDDLRSTASFQQETGIGSSQGQWRQKIYSGSSDDSSVTANRGFSLDQPQFDSVVTCQGLATSFQIDQISYGSPSTILHGVLGSDSQQQQQSDFENRPMNYPYPPSFGLNSDELLPNSWSKYSQFLRTSPPKQQPHSQLQFSNNTPFWNATAAAMNDVRPSFFPPLQPPFPPPTFDEKPKITSEVREAKKSSGSEASNKRPRNETTSPLPPFKVRKEKMGDRITALQQLVSPFGKTDTASVLSEAIEYIKFLHDQVNTIYQAFGSPYMKSGGSIQHQKTFSILIAQKSEKSKDPEGAKQDLRSRGLCLVPVSSTYPVTHETTVDFWGPTFGGTFR
ncbi:unnamed protein product [Camellia sinensis]